MIPAELMLFSGAAFFAAAVSAVAGAGMTAVLLPVLVLFLGIHEAIPVVTFALIAASCSRVAVNWRWVALPVVGWLVLGALPMTVLGTYLFTITEPGILTRLLGLFLVGSVVYRRLNLRPPVKRGAVWFLPIGAVFGFLVGLVSGVGPFLAPFFLAYGLTKGAYVGTAGLAILIVQAAKLIVFGQTAFLTAPIVRMGAVLVPFIVLGTVAGKLVMVRLPERVFVLVIEAVMLLAGLVFLVRG